MTLTEELGIKPGDIFYNSWGYDQTNVDFYEVVRVTACKAEIRPIGLLCESNAGPHDNVVPNRTVTREWDTILNIERDDERKTKLCTVKRGWRGEPSIVLESGHHWASRWDGRPKYQTGYGFGH